MLQNVVLGENGLESSHDKLKETLIATLGELPDQPTSIWDLPAWKVRELKDFSMAREQYSGLKVKGL